jgi:hypothetical protein
MKNKQVNDKELISGMANKTYNNFGTKLKRYKKVKTMGY